jgi:hypothetical protein
MSERAAGHEAGGPNGSPASPSFVDVWVSEYKSREELYRPIMLALPSGKSVKVQRMPLHVMWTKGIVPDSLTARVQDWVKAIDADDPQGSILTDMAGLSNDDLIKRYTSWVDMLDFVWCTCVKEPTFVLNESTQNTDFGRLWVGDVDLNDKAYLFSFAQGVDQTVEDFFREQNATLGTLPDGEGLLDPAQRVLWVERQGGRVVGVHDRPGDPRVGELHAGQDRRPEDGADEAGEEQDPDGARTEVQRQGDPVDARRRSHQPAGVTSSGA